MYVYQVNLTKKQNISYTIPIHAVHPIQGLFPLCCFSNLHLFFMDYVRSLGAEVWTPCRTLNPFHSNLVKPRFHGPRTGVFRIMKRFGPLSYIKEKF